jgi:hypothetical protein
VNFAQISPDAPQQKRQTTLRSEQFFYSHSPHAWEVTNGQVLPMLSKDIIGWGLHNVRAITNGRGEMVRLDVSRYLAEKAQAGHTVIMHDVDKADGIQSYMTRPAPHCYVDRWTRVQGGTDRTMYDQAGFDAWRASLVERGILLRPQPHDLDALLRQTERSLDLLRRRKAQMPQGMAEQYDAEIQAKQDAIETLRKALDDYSASEESFEAGAPAELDAVATTPAPPGKAAPKTWEKS